MALSITNSMTRKKELFEPCDPEGRRVSIYNCGPTVYDRFHIGNARNFVVMDIVRRYLERTYEVRFVQNLTDIDDKIINRMHQEKLTLDEVREKYIAAYYEDAAKLRVRKATIHPCATEYILQMQDLVRKLIDRNLAYEAGGSVYFRVREFAGYGKLSGRDVDEMREGARVEVSEEKQDPLDFVLWKAAKPDEPSWESPWGEGRPGWHLECSAMAMSLLGETIDIHSGGADLMFPHHENEIAQSEGCSGTCFARYWMHNGFLNINNEKMAKSTGNFLKIDQVLSRHAVPAVRAFLLSAHYRSPLDYTEEALVEAATAVKRINEGLETAIKILKLEGHEVPRGSDAVNDVSVPFLTRFTEAMDDDFNTPRAMSALHDAVSAIHETLQAKPTDYDKLAQLVAVTLFLREFMDIAPDQETSSDDLGTFTALVAEIKAQGSVRGIDFPGELGDSLESVVERLMAWRQHARKSKAFDLADYIRNGLSARGILLEDHPQGTIWKRAESAGRADA